MITQVFLRVMVAPRTRTCMCPPRHRAMSRDDHKKIESLESVISMYHSLSLGVRVPKHVSLLFYSIY